PRDRRARAGARPGERPPSRGSSRARAGQGRVLAIPRDRALEAGAERRPRLEAEELARPRSVEAPPRLAVRHLRVPDDLALEARELADQLRQVTDRDLPSRAEVDRLRAVVAVGREQQTFRAVVDVEEFARRRAVAPQNDALGR